MNYLDESKLVTKLPSLSNHIAIVGDMPRDETSKAHFTASFFGSISAVGREAGFDVRNSLLTNILDFFPPEGKYGLISREKIAECQSRVVNELISFNPKSIIFLGERSASAFKPDFSNLEDERGQPFLWNGIPSIITFHPRDIFARFYLNPLAIHDFGKAKRYSIEGWKEPQLNLVWRPSLEATCEFLNDCLNRKPYLSVDIETDQWLRITCIGFAYNTNSAFTIPFAFPSQERYWTEQQEKVIWPLLARVLESCKLIGHNAVHFDHEVLCRHKIMPNFVSDTMFAHWEVYAEMLKSLGFCSSLYTDMPYWKDVLRAARSGRIDATEEYRYNAKDAVICLQCAYAIRKELDEQPKSLLEHYRFNIRTSRAFQYMTLRGVRFDRDKLESRKIELEYERSKLQARFNAEVGRELNVRSPKFKRYLYDELKLPVQFKLSKNEAGDYEQKETADYLSLLYLARSYSHLPQVLTAAQLRRLLKRISSLNAIRTRKDGRIGWGFGLVSTETGRAAGYKPLDGCGVQPQNVDSKDRDLFCADDGGFWLKADLEGADSWTVAAQCAALGDSTMMNDLLAGIKPAQALAIAQLFGQQLISASPQDLLTFKARLKEVTKQEETERGPKRTTYDVMKAVSHGGNYGMKKMTMHQNIFKKSDGNLFIPPNDCEYFQRLYFHRYPGLNKLHETMVTLMTSKGYLDSFGGTRRYFFGRRDTSTVREMLSHLPQAHTSYATNRLIERCYYWSENRIPGTQRLILRPCNQVHDETCILFDSDRLDYVRSLFHRMTDVPMECWGIKFTIPFEAMYGPNWGNCKEEL